MSAKVSVVVPIYKVEKYLKKYKESPHFPTKIVDNGYQLCYIYSARLEKKVFFLCLKKRLALVVNKEVAICVQELL